MSAMFEEIDWQPTAMGTLSLRRRRHPSAGTDVYEVMLGEEFLMSSLFTAAEEELARLGLAAAAGEALDVAVGGLGLGHTAATALDDPRVASLVVIEALAPVLGWHRDALVPLGSRLADDPRCRMVEGDFFAMAGGDAGLDPDQTGRRFDAILVDIDHSPRNLLHPSHATFYEPAGLRRLAAWLKPDGVFALWSNDPPDDAFVAALAGSFRDVREHVVRFDSAVAGGSSTNTVYVAYREDR